jgi:hypothetical protein
VSKKGKPLNDCAMNRGRDMVMCPGFFQSLSFDRIKAAAAGLADRSVRIVKDFVKASKNIISDVTKELKSAAKVEAVTTTELETITATGLERLGHASQTAVDLVDEIVQSVTDAVEGEGGPEGLIASSYASYEEDGFEADTDEGIVKLRNYIAEGLEGVSASNVKVEADLDEQLQAGRAEINGCHQSLVEKVQQRQNAAMERNQKQLAQKNKKEKVAVDRVAESEERKRKAAAVAAVSEAPSLKKKRVPKAVQCDINFCLVTKVEGDNGWVKCRVSKKCKRHFCPLEDCQKIIVRHEAVCVHRPN